MDINHLLNIGKTTLNQAIMHAPTERPSFVTARHSFSWTAFTTELMRHSGSELVIAEVREALVDHLKPIITELVEIFRQEKRTRRQLRLKWEEKELKKRRSEYEKAHAQAKEHMQNLYLKNRSKELKIALDKFTISYEEKHLLSKPNRQVSRRKTVKAKHLAYEELREKELQRWRLLVEPVEKILRDALGDLYGSGTIAHFLSPSGNVDWNVLSQIAGLPINDVKRTAQNECKYLLMELKDTIMSHRDQIQKWLSETRLGI